MFFLFFFPGFRVRKGVLQRDSRVGALGLKGFVKFSNFTAAWNVCVGRL